MHQYKYKIFVNPKTVCKDMQTHEMNKRDILIHLREIRENPFIGDRLTNSESLWFYDFNKSGKSYRFYYLIDEDEIQIIAIKSSQKEISPIEGIKIGAFIAKLYIKLIFEILT